MVVYGCFIGCSCYKDVIKLSRVVRSKHQSEQCQSPSYRISESNVVKQTRWRFSQTVIWSMVKMNEHEVFHDLIHACCLGCESHHCTLWTMAFAFRILRLCKCHSADKGSAVFIQSQALNESGHRSWPWLEDFCCPHSFSSSRIATMSMPCDRRCWPWSWKWRWWKLLGHMSPSKSSTSSGWIHHGSARCPSCRIWILFYHRNFLPQSTTWQWQQGERRATLGWGKPHQQFQSLDICRATKAGAPAWRPIANLRLWKWWRTMFMQAELTWAICMYGFGLPKGYLIREGVWRLLKIQKASKVQPTASWDSIEWEDILT